MKLSARNVLPGTVKEIVTGAVTSHVRLQVGDTLVTASITSRRSETVPFRALSHEKYAICGAFGVAARPN